MKNLQLFQMFFTVDTTIINGHGICKLKSLKIYYGEIFEIKVSLTIYKYFIQYEFQSIFSVESINYLNRNINHEVCKHLFCKNIPNLSVVWSHHRDFQQEILSFIIHDKSNEINQKRYKSEIFDHRQIIKSELNKYIEIIFFL